MSRQLPCPCNGAEGLCFLHATRCFHLMQWQPRHGSSGQHCACGPLVEPSWHLERKPNHPNGLILCWSSLEKIQKNKANWWWRIPYSSWTHCPLNSHNHTTPSPGAAGVNAMGCSAQPWLHSAQPYTAVVTRSQLALEQALVILEEPLTQDQNLTLTPWSINSRWRWMENDQMILMIQP